MKRYRLILTTLLFAALAFSGCSGRKSEQYRSEGDTLFKLGKYPDAMGAYRRAEEMNPQNAQAKLGIGRCLEAENKSDEALKQYQAAIAADPSLEPAFRDAARILIRLGRGEEALSLADQLAKAEPVKGAVLGASILRDNKKAAEAIARLEKLSADQAKDPTAQLELAAACKDTGDFPRAEALVREYLTQTTNPVSAAAAQLLLVDLCFSQNKADAIIAEFEGRLKTDPEDVSAELGLAEALLRAGRLDEAEQHARKLYDRQQESGWGNYLVGTCLLAKKQYGDAVPYLERAAEVLPQQPQVARSLAVARSGGKGEPASKPTAAPQAPPSAVAQTPAVQPMPTDWHSLWKQAALKALIERRNDFLAANEPNVVETLALAAFFVKDEAVLKELGPKIPENSPLHGYFRALQGRQSAPFIEQMKSWTETDEERSVLRANALGVGLAQLGARFHAMHALTEAATQYPTYGVTYYNLAQVLRAAGTPSVGARALQKLLPLAIGNIEIHSLMYTLQREAGKYDDAQKSAEMAYSLFPGTEEACLNLSQAYLDNQETAMAEAVLQRADQEHPDSPRILLALARLRVYQNQPDQALALIGRVPDSPDSHANRQFVEVFAQAGLKNWAAVIEQTPGATESTAPMPLRLVHATALTAEGKMEDAKTLIESAGAAGSELAIAAGALGGTAPARPVEAELSRALQAAPESLVNYLYALASLAMPAYGPAAAALQATYDGLGGNPVLAGDILRVMVKTVPAPSREETAKTLAAKHADSGDVQLGLADVYASLKKPDLEQTALEQAVSLAPDFPEALRREGGFFESQSNWEGAVGAYEKLLVLLPDDLAGNNNLAYCLLLSGKDLDKALACAQRALAKQPSSAQVLHTLGAVQLARNELDQSAQNLKTALALRPADPTLVLDYGKLLMAQGNKEEGLRHIEMSIQYGKQFDLPFPRREEALNLLQQNQKAPVTST